MKILEQALNKIKTLSKNQRNFFCLLTQTLIGTAGNRTFRNLSRHMQRHERTIARQMKNKFDFIELNKNIIQAIRRPNEKIIAVQDDTFVPKAGEKTPGIDHFYDSSNSQVKKGLEVNAIGVTIIREDGTKEAYALSAQQTPADPVPLAERKKKNPEELTRIDAQVSHLEKTSGVLLKLGVKHIAVDGFFAKIKYVTGAIALGLQVISRLRKDARLRHVYDGPQKARGRKKKFADKKVELEDFNSSAVTKVMVKDKEHELRHLNLYTVSLKRIVRVVLVSRWEHATKQRAHAMLFSTDLNLDAFDIHNFYAARFHIEFLFRDAKGFTGFADCQSRNADRLNYHFNASLSALNATRAEDHLMQECLQQKLPFSMVSWSRKKHVEIVLDRFISMFDLNPTLIKSNPQYSALLEFGSVIY